MKNVYIFGGIAAALVVLYLLFRSSASNTAAQQLVIAQQPVTGGTANSVLDGINAGVAGIGLLQQAYGNITQSNSPGLVSDSVSAYSNDPGLVDAYSSDY